MLIDTHTHIYGEDFDIDRHEMIERALQNGVERLLLPNIDVESIAQMQQLVEAYPNHCFQMMGLHPGYVKEDWENQLATIEQALFSGDYIAVGEIGIDLYWDKTFIEAQKTVFRTQVNWAKQLNLPIVIHAREAFDEIFEILDELNTPELTGIFHCFTGTIEQAKKALSYGGFKLGIGGVLTYKKAGLDEVLQQLSIQDLVLETDAPYLPPVPYRGKRNESAYIIHIAEKLAEVLSIPLAEVEAITTQNAVEIFKKLK